MLQATWKGYNGTQEEGFTGYRASDGVFCYIEVFDAQLTPEQGQKILDGMVGSLTELKPGSLASFEETVNASLKSDSLPIDFSLAIGYQVESVLYLKTVGSGSISLKRNGHYATIITGNRVASGYIKEGDVFIFSTDYFLKEMKGEEHIRKIIHSRQPLPELEERMKVYYEGTQDGGGLVAVEFQAKAVATAMEPRFTAPSAHRTEIEQDSMANEPEATEDELPVSSPRPLRRPTVRFKLPDMRATLGRIEKKKLIGAAVIAAVLIALIMNVGHLFGNKQKVAQESKFDSIKAQIGSAATAWSEDSGDMLQALGVISQLRQSLADVKKNDKKVSAADIETAAKELDAFEAKVLKRETKTAETYYDLSIEEKGAQGSAMALDGDTVAILNRQGRIYEFSLPNKSLEKKVLSEAANAGLIGFYNGTIYFFKQGAGIYKTDSDGKTKRIISPDSQWGTIADMQVYNGNIYLLDPEKQNIYKYLVAENGYSDTVPYFSSGIPSLGGAKSFSIDVAIYVGLNDSILKYLSGQQQDFAAQLPEADLTLSKVYTDKESDSVYGLDKAKGILYSWKKDGGAYAKQIQSDAFIKCDDLVIYKDAAYILKGSAIFKVGL